jgi:hypothetical protein
MTLEHPQGRIAEFRYALGFACHDTDFQHQTGLSVRRPPARDGTTDPTSRHRAAGPSAAASRALYTNTTARRALGFFAATRGSGRAARGARDRIAPASRPSKIPYGPSI